jgi:hypothetical protein
MLSAAPNAHEVDFLISISIQKEKGMPEKAWVRLWLCLALFHRPT